MAAAIPLRNLNVTETIRELEGEIPKVTLLPDQSQLDR
jgi:hypothetical protein